MRRLVDSVLFLLVAYSVTWPLVRSFTYEAEPALHAASDALTAPLAARLTETPRHLMIRGHVPVSRAAEALVVGCAELGVRSVATVGPDGSFAAELPATQNPAACTLLFLDGDGALLTTRQVALDANGNGGTLDVGTILE